jgi:hypothetical protein
MMISAMSNVKTYPLSRITRVVMICKIIHLIALMKVLQFSYLVIRLGGRSYQKYKGVGHEGNLG